MPKTSKQPRQVPLKTGPFVPIMPRPQEETITQTQEVPPEFITERIVQLVAPGSIVTFPPNMALEDVLITVISGSIAIIPRDMCLSRNVGFVQNALHNAVFIKPSGYGPTPEGSGGIRNDNNTASLPNQCLPPRNAFNPSTPTQNIDTSSGRAIHMASYTSLSRPSEGRSVAVDLGAEVPTEPFCAILDDTAKYSCMTARALVRLADIHPQLVIRQTTPQQRQGQGYPTPVGIVHPQRFAELTLKALDPAIPPMSVFMLILEGDGPIANIEVYLGWQLFERLQARKTQLKAGDVREQNTDFSAMNRPIRQNGDARIPSNLPTVLQSDMSLLGNMNPPGPAIASYGGNFFPSNTSGLRLPFAPVDYGQSLDFSDLGSTQSPMNSLFSETPCSATTDSSLDPTFAPMDTMAGLLKDSSNDPFAGFDEFIDPAMLSK
ncbi:hypothetical protein IQ07DRAFT_424137 [Pyrenochaeta sp. DS3sAY3a]|nr:hypothetical protein IQ07DRAFT_424137 [Pyrenochaeta sp. DS3sAY3a]